MDRASRRKLEARVARLESENAGLRAEAGKDPRGPDGRGPGRTAVRDVLSDGAKLKAKTLAGKGLFEHVLAWFVADAMDGA